MQAQCEISIGIELDDVLAVAVPPEAPGIVADGPPVADEPPAADVLNVWQENKVRTYPHIHNSPNTNYDLLVKVSVSFDFGRHKKTCNTSRSRLVKFHSDISVMDLFRQRNYVLV